MISGLHIREAGTADLPAVKQLVDLHRRELGFVPLPALVAALKRGWMFVAEIDGEVVGVANWWSRRDGVVVLHNIVVLPQIRGRGIGRELLRALIAWAQEHEAHRVLLKCPADLPANGFYERVGFKVWTRESGVRRSLNCWVLEIARGGV